MFSFLSHLFYMTIVMLEGWPDMLLSIDSLSYNSSSILNSLYLDIDDCDSEDNEHTGFKWKSHIGIKTKYFYDRNESWQLISQNIIQ